MFSHLHCHFIGSYSDSVLKIEPAIKKVKSLSQPAIAMTDHGEIPFIYEFYDTCKKYNVKPIFGSEIYFVDNAIECIEKGINERFHLVLLAKNEIGLKNLYCLLSDSWLENTFKERRGLVDWKLLQKYSNGLVALSGCFFNIVSQTFIKKGLESAEAEFKKFLDIFGNDFYAEIGRHNIPDEDKANQGLIELAKKFNITPVATNDVHYLEACDAVSHKVIMKTRYDRVSNFESESNQYWLKSEAQMYQLGFSKNWITESLKILEKFDEIKLDKDIDDKNIFLYNNNFEALINKGQAAYLSTINYIDNNTAIRHSKEVLGNDNPDIDFVARKIQGIPRKSEPDTNRIVYLSGQQIKEKIPLKRSLGKITTQWDESSCKRAGAQIISIMPSSLAEKLSKIKNEKLNDNKNKYS